MSVSQAKVSAVAPNTADREIVITRVFDAPREVVFDTWTDPEHIASWWGPKGFRTTIHQMDVKPGGVWRFIMHGPDGVDYENENVYAAVDRPERLVYKHNSTPQFEATITFAEHGNQTELTMRMLFATAEERDRTVKTYNAIEGGNQTLDRLGDRLRKIAEGNSGSAGTIAREVVLTRTFAAPRARVFEMWIKPELLKVWWGPKGFTNPVCEVDPRPGGAILIHMQSPDGTVYPMSGVYREVTPPERLVFSSSALDEKGDPIFEVLNTVTFTEQAGQTELTLRAAVGMETDGAARFLAGMEQGWSQSLDRLVQQVQA